MGTPALTSRGFVEKDFEQVRMRCPAPALLAARAAVHVRALSSGHAITAVGCGRRGAQVAAFVDAAVKITQGVKTKFGPKLKDFRDYLATNVSGPRPRARRSGARAVARAAPRAALLHARMPTLVADLAALHARRSQTTPEIEALKKEVEAFAMGFPTIGFEKSEMRYKS